jgi:hypothetical protein
MKTFQPIVVRSTHGYEGQAGPEACGRDAAVSNDALRQSLSHGHEGRPQRPRRPDGAQRLHALSQVRWPIFSNFFEL